MSFRSEYQELWKWFEKEEEKLEKDHTPKPGLDDNLPYARRPIVQEYNRRLAELKQRYGQ